MHEFTQLYHDFFLDACLQGGAPSCQVWVKKRMLSRVSPG